MIPKGFDEELEGFGVDACSFVCGTIESLVTEGYFPFGLPFFWVISSRAGDFEGLLEVSVAWAFHGLSLFRRGDMACSLFFSCDS